MNSLRPIVAERLAALSLEAAQIERGAKALLHPETGIMRGLYPTDGDKKLLRISVGELRKVQGFILTAHRMASAILETEERT